MTALPKPVSFIRSTPPLADLREALLVASSVTEAADKLNVDSKVIVYHCQKSGDEELRTLYRACVERGKRKSKNVPLLHRFAIEMWLPVKDEKTGIVTYKWLRIWGCDALDERDAMRISLRATGQNEKILRVQREERKR